MAYRRMYTITEIKGFLQIYRGNKMMIGTVGGAPNAPVVRKAEEAHAEKHVGAPTAVMKQRVNTPGQTRTDGTYLSDEDQANATLEALNSAAGQIALAALDGGQREKYFEAPLPNGKYKIAEVKDDSNKPGEPGHMVNNDPGRAGAGATERAKHASLACVKIVKGVGGTLQIQTSYPKA